MRWPFHGPFHPRCQISGCTTVLKCWNVSRHHLKKIYLENKKVIKQYRGEPREVGRGRNETRWFFGQNNLQIGLFDHEHINSMSAHAIHALFTFYLAALSRYVDTIENLDFRVLLRVTLSEFASPFSHQILKQQMLVWRSLNHAQEYAIITIVFLHLLCLSNSMVTGEVGHAVPSLLPMSNPAYLIIFYSYLI